MCSVGSDQNGASGGKDDYRGPNAILAPRLVGVMQVNLRVPDLPAGDQPVVVTVGGVASNTAMVPVAPR